MAFAPFLILIATFGVLAALSIIDLRTLLLPNKLVAAFAALGIAFHLSLYGLELNWLSMGLGALMGGGLLLLIRTVGNYFYQDDSLGLGDVKLMAAAGLWLGDDVILVALVFGAFAGVLHGLSLMAHAKITAQKTQILKDFSLPAGPGFIIGIVIAGFFKFKDVI